jgi:hypothetical protein
MGQLEGTLQSLIIKEIRKENYAIVVHSYGNFSEL